MKYILISPSSHRCGCHRRRGGCRCRGGRRYHRLDHGLRHVVVPRDPVPLAVCGSVDGVAGGTAAAAAAAAADAGSLSRRGQFNVVWIVEACAQIVLGLAFGRQRITRYAYLRYAASEFPIKPIQQNPACFV